MATDEEPPFPTPILPYHRAEYPAINPTRPELSSKGKNVLVTGGGIGVGADIATAFARSGAAHIGLVGRRANHLEANKAAIEAAYPGVKVTALTADLADGDSTTAAVQKFAAATPSGKIDVLVANAGHQSALAPFDSVARDDFWTSFEVNNRGTFDLLRAFGPLAAPGAVVLNVSTGMVQRQYMPGSPSYHASKAAAVVLFNYWAFEHPEVRVVHFHPGIFPTEMGNKTTVALGFEMPQDNPNLPAGFAVWAASPEAAFLGELPPRFVWAHWDVDVLKSKAAEIKADPNLFTFNLTVAGSPSG
ncbi:hypothetical protein B0T24DRAFT_289569 [Lasiosphaeria ovina]|uniref:Uncharacterized protein n=1 Tax=Lasiosphaeria ovina TaxID=92902 RepID=A0AAE0KDG9_9PEZI|nr:hypothetical protein B0T24DRAFT_289569 [Lasiosphaeria ovina]